MLNSSVHAASTAASTTGRYSGRQPAMHRVDRDLLDGALDEIGRHDRDDLVRLAGRAGEHPRRRAPAWAARRAARRSSPARTSPRPRLRASPSSIRRARQRAAPAASAAGGGDVGVARARAAPGPVLGQPGARAAPDAGELFPLGRAATLRCGPRPRRPPRAAASGRCRARARTTPRARCRRRPTRRPGTSDRPASRR